MSQPDDNFSLLVTLFGDVFAGRHDVYATAFPHPTKPDKVNYAKVMEPLTNQVLAAHLRGQHRVGIYPLVDNYVRWFAVDFDAPKVEQPDGTKVEVEDPFPIAWAEAEKQALAFEDAGLFVYLERSRSGKGVHLWGFFAEPVEAMTALRALKPLLVDATSYDRMYPVQSSVLEGGYGNLIALPFHGKSLETECTAFLNRDTLEPIDPLTFLQTVTFNSRYVVEELAEKAPKDVVSSLTRLERPDGDLDPSFTGRPERPMRGFLKMISEYGCKFMHHAVKDAKSITQEEWWVALGQTTCFQNGRDAAHLISALDPARYTAAATDEKYDHLLQNPPHGCAYIHAKFPKFACSGCPMKAPYHVAKKPILQLVGETKSPLIKMNWAAVVKRARQRNSGAKKIGVSWGLPVLDDVTRLRPAELCVIGARPSVGKTAFMVDRALDMARRGIPVFVFSGETGEIGLTDRFISAAAEIDSVMVRGEGLEPLNAAHYEWLERAAKELDTLPLYINYSATRADQILELIEEAILTNRIPLDQPYVVFQDYLQFGTTGEGGASEEYGRLTQVTAEFKYVAKILQQAFVTFSQLKRDTEGDEKPDLDSFKGTGRIEDAADVAMVLAGDRVSGPYAQRWLHGLKQREGSVGWSIKMLMHQMISKFEVLHSETPVQKADLFAELPNGSAEV